MSRSAAARSLGPKGIAANRQAALTRYKLNEDGTITTIIAPEYNGGSRNNTLGYYASPPAIDAYQEAVKGENVYTSLDAAQNAQAKQTKQQLTDISKSYEKKTFRNVRCHEPRVFL